MISLTLAKRELRGGLGGLRLLILTLILGIGSIAGVVSLTHAIKQGLQENARDILGGDVVLSLVHTAATPEQREILKQLGTISERLEWRSLALNNANNRQQLVEINGIDTAYPLFGSIITNPATAFPFSASAPDTPIPFIAPKELTKSLALETGDIVQIAGVDFILAGVITEQSGAISANPFGIPIFAPLHRLTTLEALQTGSLIRYYYALKLAENLTLTETYAFLKEHTPDAGWTMRDYRDASPSIRRFVEQIESFLILLALATVATGGLGIRNALHAYLQNKATTIATLKCLGGTSQQIFHLYLWIIAIVGGLSLLVGLGIGGSIPWLIKTFAAEYLPIPLATNIPFLPLLPVFSAGIFLLLLASWIPLLHASLTKSALLFQESTIQAIPYKNISIKQKLTILLLSICLVVCTLWLANNLLLGIAFLGLIAFLFAIFSKVGTLSLQYSPKLQHFPFLAAKLAGRSLRAASKRSSTVALSFGFGFSILVAVVATERVFQHTLQQEIPSVAPDYFFIDIPKNQHDAFSESVYAIDPDAIIETMPTLRGRISAANGKRLDAASVPEEISWALSGDRGLTFSNIAPPKTILASGTWWDEEYTGAPLVSIDHNIARGLGLNIGDSITLNVLGRSITAEIANTRHIRWGSFALNFTFIFDNNTLATAPYSYIATVSLSDEKHQGILLNEITQQFPSITPLHIASSLAVVEDLLQKIGMAARIAAGVAIFIGLIVFCSVAASNYQRHVENGVILRVLGAGNNQLLSAIIIEYAVLALLCAFLGLFAGMLTAYLVTTQVLALSWVWPWQAAIITTISAIGVALFVAAALLWQVLRVKPALLLREQ